MTMVRSFFLSSLSFFNLAPYTITWHTRMAAEGLRRSKAELSTLNDKNSRKELRFTL